MQPRRTDVEIRITCWCLFILTDLPATNGYFNNSVGGSCDCIHQTNDGRTQGTFYSPKFPLPYPADVPCIIYTFFGDATEIVEITFLEFDFPKPVGNLCKDYIRLYLDLDSAELPDSTKCNFELCGNIASIPKQHYSYSRLLLIRFHSGSTQGNYTGFRGIFKFIKRAQFAMKGGALREATTCSYDFWSFGNNSRNLAHKIINVVPRSNVSDVTRLESGRFFSPRYPQQYPPNTECQYVIHGRIDERIQLVFSNIQLDPGMGSCELSSDVLVIRDGPDVTSPIITIYCNTRNGETILSSGPSLHVTMTTDGQGQRQGFAAVYSFIKHSGQLSDVTGTGLALDRVTSSFNTQTRPHSTEPACVYEYMSSTSSSGTFTSPLYPQPYPADISCKYFFKGQGRERVQIIFNHLNLSYPEGGVYLLANCDDTIIDAVTVNVIIEGESRPIGMYCGDKRPPMLMSTDETLIVLFISRTGFGSGFSARFEFITDFGIKVGTRDTDIVCGFVFRSDEASNGSFTSPNFPGLYPRNTECHYLFYGNPGERIHIKFPYFDVEGVQPGCLEDTNSDYVELSNFNIKLLDRKMSRFCGTNEDTPEREVVSDSNFFRVTFLSDEHYDATGFDAFYQFRSVQQHSPPVDIHATSTATRSLPAFVITCQLFHSLTIAILFQLLVDHWHRHRCCLVV